MSWLKAFVIVCGFVFVALALLTILFVALAAAPAVTLALLVVGMIAFLTYVVHEVENQVDYGPR